VPEGILLAIPDVRVLIHEIDAVFRCVVLFCFVLFMLLMGD
jgi:hypothetical protein